MSKAALSNDIELDDRFVIDDEDDLQNPKEFPFSNKESRAKHSRLDSQSDVSESSNRLLDDGSPVDEEVSAKWKNERRSRRSIFFAFIRRNIIRICVMGLGALLAVILIGVLLRNRNTPQPARRTVRIAEHWKGFDKIENWFAFGDSWTENQFDPTHEQPSSKNPFGNPDVPDRDIKNYVGYLTLKYNHSLILTRDLGWSASTIDSHYDLGFLDWLDFAHQLHDEFEKNFIIPQPGGGAIGKGWHSDNTLFSSFFGINDILVFDKTNPQWDKVFESYASYLEKLYSASARNFLIFKIPPIEHAPSTPGDPTTKDNPEFRAVVANFNNMVTDLAQHLMDKHDDATVFLFDTYTLLQQIMDDPKSVPETQDIRETKDYCVAYAMENPWYWPPENMTESCRGLKLQEYFWRDSLHVTDHVHKAIAANVEKLLMQYTPPNTTTTTSSTAA